MSAKKPFTAIASADFDSMRLAIRGYLDIQYVVSVPYYLLLFQTRQSGSAIQPTNPVGERKRSVSSLHSSLGSMMSGKIHHRGGQVAQKAERDQKLALGQNCGAFSE